MNIYCISGLGADERIFSRLDFRQHTVTHIPWLIPEKKESLEHYAKRMASSIVAPDPVIIGVSFGGMVAIEISKFLSLKKIILISSIKTKYEKPFYFRAAAALHINKLIPLRPYKILEPIENYNLGIKTPDEKTLAADFRRNLNINYSNWAIDQVLHWNNTTIPPNLVHIHGNNDHVFPIKYIRPDFVINDGGHLMVYNHAAEIDSILMKVLKD